MLVIIFVFNSYRCRFRIRSRMRRRTRIEIHDIIFVNRVLYKFLHRNRMCVSDADTLYIFDLFVCRDFGVVTKSI